MKLDKQEMLTIALSVLSIIISLWCINSTQRKESIAFPFGPIDPENKNPFNAQSVFGQPSAMFDFSSNPKNAPYGAYQALQVMQARQNYVDMVRPKWTLNQGYENSGNTNWALSLGEAPYNAWDYL